MSSALHDANQRAARAVEGARALFREGVLAEANAFMAQALHALLPAWAESEAQATPEAAYVALERARYPHTPRLRAAVLAVHGEHRPIDFEWTWAEVERLLLFSVRAAQSPRARKLRRMRWLAASAVALVLVLVVAFRLWGRPRVEASAVLWDQSPASNVIDGVEATEWLLPDSTAGWVTLNFPRARSVHRVRVANSHNVYYVDRGARQVRVTAFGERGKLASVEGEFPKLTQDRSVLDLRLEAAGATGIRIEVLSYFGRGGGLAEIEAR